MTNAEFAKRICIATIQFLLFLLLVGIAGAIAPVI